MERAIQIFAVIHLLTIGLSHILAHSAWAEFFIALREQGQRGVFAVGFMSLFFGSIIAAFHPVWHGLPLILTILGWLQVTKAIVYFCFPEVGLRKLAMVSKERSKIFVYPGIALVVLSLVLVYHLSS